MIARLSVSHGLILLGALGMFFGNANPVLHLPLAALLYPACLGLLAREDFPFRRGWLCGLIGSAAALYWISWAVLGIVLLLLAGIVILFHFACRRVRKRNRR